MTQPQSDTPLTDKAVFKILSSLQSGTDDVVHADFARNLERALSEANAALARRDEVDGQLAQQIQQWRTAASPHVSPSALAAALDAAERDAGRLKANEVIGLLGQVYGLIQEGEYETALEFCRGAAESYTQDAAIDQAREDKG